MGAGFHLGPYCEVASGLDLRKKHSKTMLARN